MTRTSQDSLLLGEWACLGLLAVAPSHGFAVAARLRRGRDIGRVWSLSRPLTYRALDQLVERGYAAIVGEEPGIAGGNRTIFAPTRAGRAALRAWLRTPVIHLRDLRSELLLKLLIADELGVDVAPMLVHQRELLESVARGELAGQVDVDGELDVVALWRSELSHAALRFLDRLR